MSEFRVGYDEAVEQSLPQGTGKTWATYDSFFRGPAHGGRSVDMVVTRWFHGGYTGWLHGGYTVGGYMGPGSVAARPEASKS